MFADDLPLHYLGEYPALTPSGSGSGGGSSPIDNTIDDEDHAGFTQPTPLTPESTPKAKKGRGGKAKKPTTPSPKRKAIGNDLSASDGDFQDDMEVTPTKKARSAKKAGDTGGVAKKRGRKSIDVGDSPTKGVQDLGERDFFSLLSTTLKLSFLVPLATLFSISRRVWRQQEENRKYRSRL